MISDEVPSGKTSHSLADSVRRPARVGREPEPQPRVPGSATSVGRPVPGQRGRVVVALVRRLAPRAGDPAQQIQAAVPTSGTHVVRRVGRARSARAVVPSAASGQSSRAPLAGERCRGRAPAGVDPRTNQVSAGSLVDAVVDRRAASGPTSAPSPARGRCAGRAARSPSTCGSTARAAAGAARPARASALDRAERVVAVAVGPAGDDHRRARDPVVVRVAPSPCRQYGRVVLLLEPA